MRSSTRPRSPQHSSGQSPKAKPPRIHKPTKIPIAESQCSQKRGECADVVGDDVAADYTIEIGRLGRAIGLHGALAFHSSSDFEEFLQVGLVLLEDRFRQKLTIKSIAKKQRHFLLHFVEIDSRERAQSLVNARLFTTQAQTREHCALKQGEFFYFDVVGLDVIEDGAVLGRVEDIERIGRSDYLVVALDSRQAAQNLATQNSVSQNLASENPASLDSRQAPKRAKRSAKPQRFLLPYVDAYVLRIELAESGKSGGVFTQNAKSLFE